jgi:4-amino-4-deoxy-L-arabinose transferase-like glycosyltransferase
MAATVVTAADVPTTVVGDGRSMVVEYDEDFAPLRRFVGFEFPSDITPLADGSFLVVDQVAHRIVQITPENTIAWSGEIGRGPQRIRRRPQGGFLLTSVDEIIVVDADYAVVSRREAPMLKIAAPLANGNLLVGWNDRIGWLAERTPEGETVWQSKSDGYRDESDTWIDEAQENYFTSLVALDVAADGNILAADFQRNHVRVLSPQYRLIRSLIGPRHMHDLRFGPNGEIVATSPEDYQILVAPEGGRERRIETDLQPFCANLTESGTLLVGYRVLPEDEALNRTRLRESPHVPVPWYQRGLPVPFMGALLAVALALAVRWPEVSGRVRRLRAAPSSPARDSTGEPDASAQPSHRTVGRVVGAVLLTIAFGFGCFLAWQEILIIEVQGFSTRSWRFAVGCLLGGLSLRALGVIAGSSASLTSLYPASWSLPARRADRARTGMLVALSVAGLMVCLAILLQAPANEAIAVACWLAAQLWILAAAFPSIGAPAGERASGSTRIILALILLIAVGTRFWEIGYYPDYIHHDHSMYGYEVVRSQEGNWHPFFSRVYSICRPWFAPVVALFEIFGNHYWVLRVPSALAGVILTGAAYLLGKALFNERVGVVAALLVCVNQLLLLYSRQSYVLDPAAPFVLALYCTTVGLRRGSRFHMCLAGVLGAWALLGYYVSATYVPVAAAVLFYLVAVYPMVMWRQRTGVLWLVLGGVIVYLPMVVGSFADSTVLDRADAIVVFLNPDGSIRWDPDLWAHQVGSSFGAIFRFYGNDNAWGVNTRSSMCMSYVSCLFGIGLTYLLTCWRTPATFLLLAWGTLCIFFGSATLPGAPTSYHFLAAVVPILLVSAVAIDRALALSDRWPAPIRLLPLLAAVGLLSAISYDHLTAFQTAFRRPPDHEDGTPTYLSIGSITAARFVGEHPEWRHFLVRTRRDLSSTSALFRFFGARSDMSDVTTNMREVLPIPPIEPSDAASFVVLPSRAPARDVIRELYPQAALHELHSASGGDTWVFVVGANDVRRAYESQQRLRQWTGETF